MKVLILPEDFKKDQHILKPLVEALMRSIGKKAIVRVCQDPKFGGVTQVLSLVKIREVIDKYPAVDIFLVCVDRDGEAGRKDKLVHIEKTINDEIGPLRVLVAENAWQEIEVWLLAGCRDFTNGIKDDWRSQVRQDRNPKEQYYTPFAEQRGVLSHLEQGRKTLGEEAGKNYRRVRQLCPEVQDLEQRIEQWMVSRDKRI